MQMLEWIGERPRSYAETLEAWKTSCPRLTIWEDAVADGFVRVERGAVTLTSAGSSRVLGLAQAVQKVAARRPETIVARTSAATMSR